MSELVRVPLLDLQAQYASIKDEVDEAMSFVVRSQRFILGDTVDRFEDEIASLVGAKHAIGCASGTDAILLALKALELEPGDEVIVPSFTFFATAGAVWNAGLRPVFADVDPSTFNMSAEHIQAALTKRTRAIIVVHLFGQMAPMREILALAEARGIAVIEDCAQAIGATQEADGVTYSSGAVGLMGCFSFFPTKNLGAFGDAGLITTNDDRLAEILRKLRVHGGRQMYHHERVGFNSRLDALQAAVLSAKLPHLESWTEARRRNAADYDAQLAGIAGVRIPVTDAGNAHTYNQYTIRAERRDELRAYLDARGIGSGIYYPVALHLQECFASLGYVSGDIPGSEAATSEVLSLPIYPELTLAQRGAVGTAIREFYAPREQRGRAAVAAHSIGD